MGLHGIRSVYELNPAYLKGSKNKINFLGLGVAESPTYGLRLLGSTMILIFSILQGGPFPPPKEFLFRKVSFANHFLF
jgi:hypothetical protein